MGRIEGAQWAVHSGGMTEAELAGRSLGVCFKGNHCRSLIFFG
jgi:hypothetical protein